MFHKNLLLSIYFTNDRGMQQAILDGYDIGLNVWGVKKTKLESLY